MLHEPLDFSEVLQACIKAIENGDETIDSAVASYPEIAHRLRDELELAFWLQAHSDSLSPDPGFLTESRLRLLDEIRRESHQPSAVDQPELPLLHFFQEILQLFRGRTRQTAMPLVLLAVLVLSLFTGSSGVVLAAQDSLPGDNLYPVKTVLEKFALLVTLDDLSDAHLSVEYTERRLVELKRLIVEGRYEHVYASVASFENQVNSTITSLDAVAADEPVQVQILATSLESILDDQNQVLANLIEAAPDSSRTAIAKAMWVSKSGADAAQNVKENLPTPTSAPAVAFQPPATHTPTPGNAGSSPSLPVSGQQPGDGPKRRNGLPGADARSTATEEGNVQLGPPRRGGVPARPSVSSTQASRSRRPAIPTDAPTFTPLPTHTETVVPTNTAAPTEPPTQTPLPTVPATATPRPTRTPRPTFTPSPTASPTPTDTATPTETPTATYTPTPTETPTETPTSTPTPAPSPTSTEGTPEPLVDPTPQPGDDEPPASSETPSPTATPTATASPKELTVMPPISGRRSD